MEFRSVTIILVDNSGSSAVVSQVIMSVMISAASFASAVHHGCTSEPVNELWMGPGTKGATHQNNNNRYRRPARAQSTQV